MVELAAELAGVRARSDASERENIVLRSELLATKDLLTTCQAELDLVSGAKAVGGRREMLRETQRLRVQLQRSLESNRRLHDQLQQQLAAQSKGSDQQFASNCSTPKQGGAQEEMASELSAVERTPCSSEAHGRTRTRSASKCCMLRALFAAFSAYH